MLVSSHWTGLTQYTSFSVGMDFHGVGQKLNSAYYLLLSPADIFPRVSRGQRSRAHLRSCNQKIITPTYFGQKPTPSLGLKHIEKELYLQIMTAHLLKLIKQE